MVYNRITLYADSNNKDLNLLPEQNNSSSFDDEDRFRRIFAGPAIFPWIEQEVVNALVRS